MQTCPLLQAPQAAPPPPHALRYDLLAFPRPLAHSQVMPYLIRRAQENSSMLAGVGGEVAMLRTELVRRCGLTLRPPLPEG